MSIASSIRRTLQSVFRHAQQDALTAAVEQPELDAKVIAVLLTAAVILTLQNYIFRNGSVDVVPAALDWLGAGGAADWIRRHGYAPQDRQLAQLLFWAAGSVLDYVVLPSLVIKLFLRERIANYGLNFRGILGSSWVYLLMYLAMIGPLAFFSGTESFKAKYPFYHIAAGEPFWPRLWIWEAAYICQFFALEFFFRGFMLHGLRHRFGFYAIFAMTLPYCMIHYGKPMPETFGAIGAGIVLGVMSLKTRSIWFGACLHVAVALSMDFLALWHKGML